MERLTPLIPPAPREGFQSSEGLLEWMGRQFSGFGDIFSASICGISSYAIQKPEFAYHVLVENWQNYVKGQMIGRVAMLLGQGLMMSEGDSWKRQRRMAHPLFTREAMRAMLNLFTKVNVTLLTVAPRGRAERRRER